MFVRPEYSHITSLRDDNTKLVVSGVDGLDSRSHEIGPHGQISTESTFIHKNVHYSLEQSLRTQRDGDFNRPSSNDN